MFYVDGRATSAFLGESIAAALLANGVRVFRRTPRLRMARGLFCGMGVCYECVVAVEGRPSVRACMTRVEAEMRVTTQPTDEAAKE